jgi:phage baseplate assembly protein W
MSSEVLVPFTLDVHGIVAVTTDPGVQSEQHVDSLVSTNPGERVMLPNYGVPLESYLFDPGNDLLTQTIVMDVRTQMETWEPSLIVTSIQPVPNPGLGVAAVDVTWTYASQAGSTLNAVVQIGGTVVPQAST